MTQNHVERRNGGGLQGQGFRLDIDGDDIGEAEFAASIVQDMRLLTIGELRILDRAIVTKAHQRPASEQGERS